jgi:cytochrome c oxidase subunit IV
MSDTQKKIQNIARTPDEVHTYAVVWVSLLLLTAITVAVAQVRIATVTVIVCLAVASFKSILIFLFFMHLRHDKNRVIRQAVLIVLVALAIFIGLTFVDVIAR